MLRERTYLHAQCVLQDAAAAGVRVRFEASGALRISGAQSPELKRRLASVSGLLDLPPDDAPAVEAWERIASLSPELVRVVRRPDGGVMAIDRRGPERQALERLCLAQELGRVAVEALCTPVSVLRGLPLPWTLQLRRQKREWGVSTSKAEHARLSAAGRLMFVARELEAMALAAELNRAHGVDLDGWLQAKARGGWRLTPELSGAMDVRGVKPDQPALMELGQVLDWFGVELVGAAVHESKGGA